MKIDTLPVNERVAYVTVCALVGNFVFALILGVLGAVTSTGGDFLEFLTPLTSMIATVAAAAVLGRKPELRTEADLSCFQRAGLDPPHLRVTLEGQPIKKERLR